MSNQITYKDRMETKRIIVHDSHTSPEINQVHEVSRWHVDAHDGALRMGLLSIGYHYIIERDGKIVPCRPVEKIGTHAPGNNMDSIGVCLVGGRDHDGGPEENFTREQRKSLLHLIHDLKKQYGPLDVLGKTEVQRYRNRNLPPSPFLDMDLLREDIFLYEQGIMI